MVHSTIQIITYLILVILTSSCTLRGVETNTERNINFEFHDGDIAFRRGSGLVSHAVIIASNRGYHSHVGIIVELDSTYYVIHEVPYEGRNRKEDKIYCQPINQYYKPQLADVGTVYRITLDTLQRAQIRNYLLAQLQNETPFDHDYNLEDTTHQYCCELVWNAYKRANIDLTQGRRTQVDIIPFNGTYIMPSDIEENPTLTPIYSINDTTQIIQK
ncbi:MAG: YiiX/YebB-like N1pC/P60 family cysteine hydrolase [Bacteroidales bacterium]